ncbi:MAG: hypothetical protein EBT09_00730 [Actinobacteria bacterium]|nr:hypothetical protein [Actinomycetota bacterium]
MMVGNLVGGRYRIKKLLKQGGMGGVYIADDVRNPGVEWAVKVALPGTGDEARENFELAKQEAEFLRELNHTAHPNILWFQESIVTSEVQLVMELVKGKELQDVLDLNPGRGMPSREVILLAIQIAGAIACLHRRREGPVIYRDLKPGNVMVDANGVAKLVDYGIARRAEAWKRKDTIRLGTPAYAPPELIHGNLGQSSTDTDVYSFGATLYCLLTGVAPTPIETPPIGSVSARNSSVTRRLEGLIIRAMAQERSHRIQTMDVVDTELRACAQEIGLTIPAPIRTCPYCKTANRVAAAFCRTCGRGQVRFPSVAVSAPPLNQVGTPTVTKCGQCGIAQRPGARFCHMCGRRV